MIIVLRRLRTWAALSSFACIAAVATAQNPATALDKQLDRVDLGISGVGILTKSSSGPDKLDGYTLTDSPGNTVGVLVNIRYIKSPLVGLEFNFNRSRYVQNFSGTQNVVTGIPKVPPVTQPYVLDIQANAVEYTAGWVFHGPKLLGVGTFASVGAGTTDFVPTRGGGLGYLPQARATYYYSVGVEQKVLSPHFGLRASLRQAFFLAPDFETNFLTDLRHTSVIEPTAGFYLHF